MDRDKSQIYPIRFISDVIRVIVKLSAIKLTVPRGHQCIRDTTNSAFTRIMVNTVSRLKCYRMVTAQQVKVKAFLKITQHSP